MTVCKTIKLLDPELGVSYKKTEVIEDLQRPEYRAAHFYDPPRGIIYSFFQETDNDWHNVRDIPKKKFRYRLHNGGITKNNPPWERTLVRHIFYNHKGVKPGKYEYLGKSIDEKIIQDKPNAWIEFALK